MGCVVDGAPLRRVFERCLFRITARVDGNGSAKWEELTEEESNKHIYIF